MLVCVEFYQQFSYVTNAHINFSIYLSIERGVHYKFHTHTSILVFASIELGVHKLNKFHIHTHQFNVDLDQFRHALTQYISP